MIKVIENKNYKMNVIYAKTDDEMVIREMIDISSHNFVDIIYNEDSTIKSIEFFEECQISPSIS